MSFFSKSYQSVPTCSQDDSGPGKFGTVDSEHPFASPSSSIEDEDVFSVIEFKKPTDRDQPRSKLKKSSMKQFPIDSERDEETKMADESGAERTPLQRNTDDVSDTSIITSDGGRRRSQLQTKRLVFKDGHCNVSTRNLRQRRRRFLTDIFTTLLDMRWRYNFIMFGVSFLSSWFVFGLLWWTVAVAHGDHLFPNSSSWEPCVSGVYDFKTAFLFSVETQHTTGYGSRVIEPHCPQGIVLLLIQACCGIFIQSLMTGLIFAKLSRPKPRANTMMFSRNAVVCIRDGEYCLLFRLGDMRSAHLVDTSIRALIVTDRTTKEGELVPLCQNNFTIETETDFDDSFVFLVWPTTFVHRIVPGSPLWSMSADQLLAARFEIIVILEGVIESTGYCIQIRTSYLPSEILWGHRLAPLVTYEKRNGRYEIDFKHFHGVVPVASMPQCSAEEYAASANRSAVSDEEESGPSFVAGSVVRPGGSKVPFRRLVSRRKSSRAKILSSGGDCSIKE